MPRPPPPAEAFKITGYPISPANWTASSAVFKMPGEPGRIGTPASRMNARARSFTPISRITSGRGPMNFSPETSHTSAKPAFSLRKP